MADGGRVNGRGSPRLLVVLVFVRVWRSIDEVARVKRRSQREVVRLGLVDTVVEPKGLLSRRASQVFVPKRASGLSGRVKSSTSSSRILT